MQATNQYKLQSNFKRNN